MRMQCCKRHRRIPGEVVRSSGLASVKAFFQPCGVLLEVSALAGLFHGMELGGMSEPATFV